jgi:hypothetical protein
MVKPLIVAMERKRGMQLDWGDDPAGWEANAAQLADLATGFVALSRHLDPKTAFVYSDRLLRRGDFNDSFARERLAKTMAESGARLPVQQVASTLSNALRRSTDNYERRALAEGLVSACRRLPPPEGVDRCLEAAGWFVYWLSTERDGWKRSQAGVLAKGLAAVCEMLPPEQAREICGAALAILQGILLDSKNPVSDEPVALSLTAVCRFLPAAEAVQVFFQVMSDPHSGENELQLLAEGLAVACRRLPPGERTGVGERASHLLRARVGSAENPIRQRHAVEGLMAVLTLLPESTALECRAAVSMQVAQMLRMADGPNGTIRDTAGALANILSGRTKADHDRLASAQGLEGVAGPAIVTPAVRPASPPALSTQALVELLKHPLVVREARRAVLDALESVYSRPFSDLWDFVTFTESLPDGKRLDLLAPPQRPAR